MFNKRKPLSSTIMTVLLCSTVMGCTGTLNRLEEVGIPPKLNEIDTKPTENIKPESNRYKPAAMNTAFMGKGVSTQRTANSLWQDGNKTFFDQRAQKPGDILTVKIAIKDKAELDNKTERSRTSKETMGAPAVFGLEKKIVGMLPEKANPASLLSLSGNNSNKGEGVIEREEEINTEIAAMITDVMPNGNFLIQGSQEILVNFEVREIAVRGIVRPGDISPDNTIALNQIAEARVSYGGRGHLMDMQQPRVGNQLIDILSPF